MVEDQNGETSEAEKVMLKQMHAMVVLMLAKHGGTIRFSRAEVDNMRADFSKIQIKEYVDLATDDYVMETIYEPATAERVPDGGEDPGRGDDSGSDPESGQGN